MAMKSYSQPDFSIVFFDLEATGLSVTDEITQIAAKCGDASHNQYVIPEQPIPKAITNMTGISMINKQMYYNGNPVDGVSPAIAVSAFISFLESVGGKVVLISHNCFNSDGPTLAGLVDQLDMLQRFKRIVIGFSDSLPLMRKSLPNERPTGKGYKLSELAKEFFGSSKGAHNALEDVIMLEKLICHPQINISADDIINSRQIVGAMIHKYKNRLNSYNQSLRYDDDFYYIVGFD
ncbi:uncharacterized protein LOC107038083 [Diachasma alloeum]|uniref:uncharacterized protein LOC107038083 n=1 Tax=Diachasma alloeum TaxID=454923 RepID=UPI0007381045|nr:uncharacterized protein LOC107038083 [Diachasma alloeum]